MDKAYHGQFLGLPPCPAERADAVVLPVPLEATVSYGTGTAGGPGAILEASCQVELFDEETLVDFEQAPRVHTAPPIRADGELTKTLSAIRESVSSFSGRFVLVLGGEHTLTYGVVQGLIDDPARLTIVHLDAHADLAEELEGQFWSHGTVMRRLWEQGCRIVQAGVRSLSRAEHEFARSAERLSTYYAHQMDSRWEELMEELLGLQGPVFLSIDVDGLDPSVIPSTGTPQPDGLSWRDTMDIIHTLCRSQCDLLGADIVEFIPSPNPPGCDIVAARLAQKVLAWWFACCSGSQFRPGGAG